MLGRSRTPAGGGAAGTRWCSCWPSRWRACWPGHTSHRCSAPSTTPSRPAARASRTTSRSTTATAGSSDDPCGSPTPPAWTSRTSPGCPDPPQRLRRRRRPAVQGDRARRHQPGRRPPRRRGPSKDRPRPAGHRIGPLGARHHIPGRFRHRLPQQRAAGHGHLQKHRDQPALPRWRHRDQTLRYRSPTASRRRMLSASSADLLILILVSVRRTRVAVIG